MAKRKLIAEKDLLTMKFLRQMALSPDEKEIVYVLEHVDEKDNKYYSSLFILDADGGNNRQFTFGKYSDSQAVWSPDGKKIAFVSKRGEKSGIHVINRDGGEARKLIEGEGGFANLSFSPDGKFILYNFRKADVHKDKDGKRVAPVYRHITRLFYRLDGEGWLPQDRFHIYKCEAASGRVTQLTRGKTDELAPTFSPDGKSILFITNRQPDPDRMSDRQEFRLINSDGENERKVDAPLGPKAAPAFSPDGKKVAYLGHTDLKDAWGVTNVHVWVVEPGKKNSARDLTPKLDRMCMDMVITDTGEVHESGRVVWSGDGKKIFHIVSDRGNTLLYSVTLDKKLTQLTKARQRVMDFDLKGKKSKIFAVVSNFTSCGDIFSFTLDGRGKQLTEVNMDWFAKMQVQIPEEVWFKSTGGQKVQGWILKPPNFNPRRQYPAIVEVHGGPRVQYGNVFFHEMQYLAAKGFVVFYSNPRGSQGYGEKFAGCIVNNWGSYDYQDVMAGAELISGKSYVNKKKLGITGGSYGGYMTNWVVGHTNRFRAAVTQRSVVNLLSFSGSSDIGFEDWREFGGQPWDNWYNHLRMSPIYYVKNIRTPLLIIHNEGDLRCHIEQAEQLYTALKILKRKVDFIRFPEEFHGLSRCGRPDRRMERLRRISGWFEKHLK